MLVIDEQPNSRNLTCMQLRGMGIAQITQCARQQTVRLALENETFDIVLASIDIADADAGWLDLLDELRREGLLPHSTVLFLLTAEASYARVREAAEAALDGCLLRPYNAATLEERLQQAWRRKQELAELLQLLRESRFEEAARWCGEHVRRKQKHATFAARVGCELLLRLGRAEEVPALCDALDEPIAPEWMRLNLVRALYQRGEAQRARRQCEQLVDGAPMNADALDLLGQLHAEAGDLAAALAAARGAVQRTPGCVLRLQNGGALAFYCGETPLAHQLLSRAVGLGLRSRLFDALTLMFLGVVQFDLEDSKYLPVTRSHLALYTQRHADSQRLRRFDIALAALRHLQMRELDPAGHLARQLAAEMRGDAFDLEAAVVTLAVWSRLPSRELGAGELEQMLRTIGLRHAGSRASLEVMLASLRDQPQMAQVLQDCHAQVGEVAEASMARAMSGDPGAAVQTLLDHGRRWRSTKLLELCVLVARRRAAALDDAGQAVAAEAGAELRRLDQGSGTHLAGQRRTGRSTGGLILRR